MDYSLLLGIHNLDKEPKAKNFSKLEAYYEAQVNARKNQESNEEIL